LTEGQIVRQFLAPNINDKMSVMDTKKALENEGVSKRKIFVLILS
jgi:hypothetical protein